MRSARYFDIHSAQKKKQLDYSPLASRSFQNSPYSHNTYVLHNDTEKKKVLHEKELSSTSKQLYRKENNNQSKENRIPKSNYLQQNNEGDLKRISSSVKIDDYGDRKVNCIINRFDNFFDNLKHDRKEFFKNNDSHSNSNLVSNLYHKKNSFFENTPNGSSDLHAYTSKNSVYSHESFNATNDYKNIIKEFKTIIYEKEAEIKNLKLKLNEEKLYTKKLYNQRNMLANVTGIQKGSPDEVTLNALAYSKIITDDLPNDINIFVQENFILKKYNEELRAILKEVQKEQKKL